jgi:hypothetical protein
MREAAIRGDVEGGEPYPVGLDDDQGGIVGCHGHAVGEGELARDLAYRAVGGDQRNDAGGRERASRKLEANVVDIGVAPTVHNQIVPGMAREAAQVGMCAQRPVMLPTQQEPVPHRDDQQAPIGQEAQAQ